MKRAVLHIGLPKTGTTSIQAFLAANAGLLEEQGACFFPQPASYINPYKDANGTFIIFHALSEMGIEVEESYMAELGSVRDALIRFCEGYDTILLSSEDFYRTESFDPDTALTYWTIIRDFFRSAFGDECVMELILHLRRQDLWCESHWKMMVTKRKEETHLPFEYAMWKYENNVIDYDAFLEHMEDVFGIEHVKVRLYDDFRSGGLIEDYIAAAGLKWDDRFEKSDRTDNISVTSRIAWAMREINLGNVSSRVDRASLIRSARRLAPSCPDERGTHVMTPDERKELMSLVSEGNRNVARRYFGRDELFSMEDFDAGPFCGQDVRRDRALARRIAALAWPVMIWRKIKNRCFN